MEIEFFDAVPKGVTLSSLKPGQVFCFKNHNPNPDFFFFVHEEYGSWLVFNISRDSVEKFDDDWAVVVHQAKFLIENKVVSLDVRVEAGRAVRDSSNKIQAIKALRSACRLGLKEAKDEVEAAAARMGHVWPSNW